MSKVYYTTVTSKGQITLPAAIRRKLKVKSGQKLSVSEHKNKISINAPIDLDDLRARNQQHLKKMGFTPDKLRQMAENYQNGDGFEAYVKEKYGQS